MNIIEIRTLGEVIAEISVDETNSLVLRNSGRFFSAYVESKTQPPIRLAGDAQAIVRQWALKFMRHSLVKFPHRAAVALVESLIQDDSSREQKPVMKPVRSDRQRLLEEAIGTICRDRNEEYGGPESSFQTIADFWNTYLNHRQPGPLTPGDVALMMDLMKTARLCANPKHADSVRDKAGYTGCYAEVAGIYAEEDDGGKWDPGYLGIKGTED